MMAGTLRVRRSQGAISGMLLVLLGIWGALIPFVGPYFHYAYTPNRAWDFTAGRMWLEVLPGVVAIIGGVVVLISRFRPAAVLGAWLATLAGGWFVVGHLIAAAWTRIPGAGQPVGGATRAAFEEIGLFAGLGVVILFVAALALGRFTVVAARDKVDNEDILGERGAGRRGAKTPEPVPAGATSATGTFRRAAALPTAMVPVFRGRQRTAAANAAAGRAAAEADIGARGHGR
ncbi:MAG TPA: hypothetical protein VLM11_05970 [Streptosporangiaceae bacterium]|nr:hypothetical protein [Streptosporangiaceae bacterium]